MVNAQHGTPFCLEILEGRIKSVNGSTITAAQGRRLLVEMVGCFVEVGRQVGDTQAQVVEISKQVKGLDGKIGPEEEDHDSDSLKSIGVWFADKVLPSLLTTGILAVIVWVAALNNLICLTPP